MNTFRDVGGDGVGRNPGLPRKSRGKRPRHKSALVLAGGGIAGAVYEIGALRAMDEMLVGQSVNDFDIYVGTSAGALVCAMLANGFTPGQMMQRLDNSHPELRALRVNDIFQAHVGELIRSLRHLPQALWHTGSDILQNRGEMTFPDLLWNLAEVLPRGLYDPASLETFVRHVMDQPGCHDRFDQLDKTLVVVATELNTGERAVFGRESLGAVPISKAVAASSAVPLLYRPHRVLDKEYIDGVFRGTASLDLAIEAGAKLVVCINPLTPLDTQKLAEIRHLSDRGVQAIINQVLRIVLHAGLRYHVKNMRVKYPDVDIILIEPRADDTQMFFRHLMRYSARLTIAEHAFERVTLGLNEHYAYFKGVLARHNIRLSRRLVMADLEAIRASGYDPAIFRNVMEGARHRMAGAPEPTGLASALTRLESSLKVLNETVTPGGL